MDNSFDKLNDQFTDKARGGFKYWFWLIFSYVFAVLGVAIGVYALLPGNNRYLSLPDAALRPVRCTDQRMVQGHPDSE